MKKPITDLDKFRKAFVVSGLRKASYRWPPRTEAKRLARVSRGVYQCFMCQGLFKDGEIRLDHKSPVVDVKTGFTDWNAYVLGMFCPVENFSVLCNQCHLAKSSTERSLRKEYRKLNKNSVDTKRKKK